MSPKEYGPYKTLYDRFTQRSGMDIFTQVFAELAVHEGQPDQSMSDVT